MEYDIHTLLDLATLGTALWVIYMIHFKLRSSYVEDKDNFAIYYVLSFASAACSCDGFIGVNVGTALSDMPSPTQVVALLKAQQIRHVRLYDADRAMLVVLANTGIRVAVSVPNDQLLGIGQSNITAANWVSRNILAHVPAKVTETLIKYIPIEEIPIQYGGLERK